MNDTTIYYRGKQYDRRHGGPFDRGSADSWYSRGYNPHYYIDGTYQSRKIVFAERTSKEIDAYAAGYNYNEEYGGKKEW